MAALSRIEILKEGAAATYGSDAIAGVVNFITDSDFEGLRVNMAAKDIPNAQGEANEFSITYGTKLNDGTNFLLSLGSQFKPEYYARNSDYTKYPASQNPYGGWSSIGNPGTFIVQAEDGHAFTGSATTGKDPVASIGDPGCNTSGGYHSTAAGQKIQFRNKVSNAVESEIDLNGYEGICRYNYAYFDNVQEEQTNSQLWMEFNGDINNQNFHVEFAYGKTDVPQYATSPAYPPNDPNSTFVPNIHPALQKLYTQKPDFLTLMSRNELNGSTINDNSSPAPVHLMRTRVIASAGNPTTANPNGAETAFRKYDTYRFGFSFDGELTNGIDYSTSLNYSSTENTSTASDTQAHKYTAALFGYGGPNCGYEVTAMGTAASGYAPTLQKGNETPVVASLVSAARPAGCSFLNVFSNAFEQASQPYWGLKNATNGDNQIGTTLGGPVGKNPLYDKDLANSDELLQ